ncbi:MAG: DUF4105 domain-containing protein [Aquabacterium sp.]
MQFVRSLAQGLWRAVWPLATALLSATASASDTAWPAPALPPAQQAYLHTLQAQARAQHLAQHPMWRTLLHMRVHPLTGRDRSLADDPGFFTAPDGAHQPAAELDATLAAFFDPRPRFALDQPAACRFIARHAWLSEQLHFDPTLLPTPTCPRYETWRAGLQAGQATLVFPAAYLNAPASMYGHTFLRLDPPASEGGFNPLLSYAISYAADGNEAEGLAFALKGLTGLYPGQFTNSPYYLRIRDYNDLENRDIWEYELNLSPTEMERLLAHTWELGSTRFDYFFFDENCSYHLLSLLDAARPELHLTDRFTWWAIPVDTVRAVLQAPGLLKQVRYRPANSTELRERAHRLGPKGTAEAKQLASQRLTPTQLSEREPDPLRRSLILETAERYVAYEGSKNESTEAAIQARRMSLLIARSALPSAPEPVMPPRPTPPTEGHATGRIDLLTGQRGGEQVWSVMWRPAYHDLLDPEPGYQRGAAIQFGRLELAYSAQRGLRLDRFTPVEIQSLSPIDGILDARSWRVKAGWRRSWGPDARQPYTAAPLAFEANGGPGLSTELGTTGHALGYVFMDNQFWLDHALPARDWSIATGLATGLLWDASAHWRMQLEGYARVGVMGQPAETGLNLTHRWALNAQTNLQARCEWARRAQAGTQRACLLGVQRYW